MRQWVPSPSPWVSPHSSVVPPAALWVLPTMSALSQFYGCAPTLWVLPLNGCTPLNSIGALPVSAPPQLYGCASTMCVPTPSSMGDPPKLYGCPPTGCPPPR